MTVSKQQHCQTVMAVLLFFFGHCYNASPLFFMIQSDIFHRKGHLKKQYYTINKNEQTILKATKLMTSLLFCLNRKRAITLSCLEILVIRKSFAYGSIYTKVYFY